MHTFYPNHHVVSLPNGGHLQLFCSKYSCQVSWCWTVSQPASYWTEEAGPFITCWCSTLWKWCIGSWQMWVSFIGQNDNHRLLHHESNVGGVKEKLWRLSHKNVTVCMKRRATVCYQLMSLSNRRTFWHFLVWKSQM